MEHCNALCRGTVIRMVLMKNHYWPAEHHGSVKKQYKHYYRLQAWFSAFSLASSMQRRLIFR